MDIAPRPHQVRRLEVVTDECWEQREVAAEVETDECCEQAELESYDLNRVDLNEPPSDSGSQD